MFLPSTHLSPLRPCSTHGRVLRLQVWQKSLGSSGNEASTAVAKSKSAAAAQPLRKEFGADLEFHFPRLQARPDEAELDSLVDHGQTGALGSTCAPITFSSQLSHVLPSFCVLLDVTQRACFLMCTSCITSG